VRARYRIVLAAAVLLLTLSELPLTFAEQVDDRYTYGTHGTPFWGWPISGDISGIGIGAGLASLPFMLEEVARQMQQLAPTVQQQSQRQSMPTGIIEQPGQAEGAQTGAVGVDPKQQAQISQGRLVQQRRDATVDKFREDATKRGWKVKELKPGEREERVTMRELLDFMRENEAKLRRILG